MLPTCLLIAKGRAVILITRPVDFLNFFFVLIVVIISLLHCCSHFKKFTFPATSTSATSCLILRRCKLCIRGPNYFQIAAIPFDNYVIIITILTIPIIFNILITAFLIFLVLCLPLNPHFTFYFFQHGWLCLSVNSNL